MSTHDKRRWLIQWLYATVLKIFGHIKNGVHCLSKTTDSRNGVIRQKEFNFYVEMEKKMIFQDIIHSIVLIY